MSDLRPIVVVADDLGLRAEWDTAIFAAHDRGFVQAVSVVANGPRYERMLPGLRQRPDLEVGAHLNVFEGKPLSPVAEVPTLGMPGSVAVFFAQWLVRRVRAAEVEAEWRRQLQRLVDDGLKPTFLNSHYHLHLFPDLFEVTIRLAQAFSIQHIRVTDEPPWLTGRLRPALRTAPLWALGQRARRRLREIGFPPPPTARGLAASAALGVAEWQALLAEPGTSAMEIICHPGQSPLQKEALDSQPLLDALRQRAVPFSYRT